MPLVQQRRLRLVWLLRRAFVAACAGAIAATVAVAPAGAVGRTTPPPVPACWHSVNGCPGFQYRGPVSPALLTSAKHGVFSLSGPAPLQTTSPVACGDEGCLYNHLNWGIGPGGSSAGGCVPNTTTCKVKIAPGSTDWVPVIVNQNDYPQAFWLLWTPANPASIEGKVVSDSDHKPVSGVTVTAKGSKGGGSDTTGQDGTYEIDVSRGDYTVTPSSSDAEFTPKSRKVTAKGTVKGVDFTAKSPGLEGKVIGQTCTENGCARNGMGKVKILVSGHKRDGTPVSDTAVSKSDGKWSLDIPAGKYDVGPTSDGSTFDVPGFDPDQQSATVTKKVTKVGDFVACEEDSGGSGSSRAVRVTSTRAHTASDNANVSLCQSVYRLHISAGFPTEPLTGLATVVDPSNQARYSRLIDPRLVDYQPSSSLTGFITNRIGPIRLLLGKGKQYPACFSDAEVKELTDKGDDFNWYSYITGPGLASYDLKLAWNQSEQKVKILTSSLKRNKITKVFMWRNQDTGETGHCDQTVTEQAFVLPIPQSNQFTILLSYSFPFEPRGAKAEDSEIIKSYIDRDYAYYKKVLGKYGDKLAREYEHNVPEAVRESAREAFEIAIAYALAESGFTIAELTPEAITVLTGRMSPAAVELIIKYAKIIGNVKDLSELTGLIGGYGGQYPVMAAVIRGKFTSKRLPDTRVSIGTSLSISTKTTKFPTFGFFVTRDVEKVSFNHAEPYGGLLPWVTDLVGAFDTPAVANSFSPQSVGSAKLPPAYNINDASLNGHTYSGGDAAVKNMQDDTEGMDKIAESIREGNIAKEFNAEKSEATPAPACSYEGLLSFPAAGQICWHFRDGRA